MRTPERVYGRSFPQREFPSKNSPNIERRIITDLANLFAVFTTLRRIPLLVRTAHPALPQNEGLSFHGLVSLPRLPTNIRSRVRWTR